jgi:hypothetical protein
MRESGRKYRSFWQTLRLVNKEDGRRGLYRYQQPSFSQFDNLHEGSVADSGSDPDALDPDSGCCCIWIRIQTKMFDDEERKI